METDEFDLEVNKYIIEDRPPAVSVYSKASGK